MGFTKLVSNKDILKSLVEMGFSAPTPIQAQALPLLSQGEDLIGQAQTGTGKTAAFGICILERLANPQSQHAGAQAQSQDRSRYSHHEGSYRKPRALILAPTRELAVQITVEIDKIGKHLPLRTVALYGGQDIERQIAPLRAGVDIIVGTPGRLLDHIERKTLQLDAVEVVVLDEADRMLDMGFIDDIEKILKRTPQSRQTMLFSATMPPAISELGRKYLKSPQEVRVSEDSLSVKNIKQYYVETSKFDKLNFLLALLQQKKPHLALIFVRTKRGADRLNDILTDRGFNSMALHGDMSQNKRDRSMEAFRKKRINILVATDLASRGLDVTDISHVFNYDMTDDPMVYLHRIGRTGRMGKDGESISLLFFDQTSMVSIIQGATDSKLEQIKVEFKQEDLPKRVRFTPHESDGEGRFGGSRGGRGSFGGREGGRGGRFGSQGGPRFGRRESGRSGGSGGFRGRDDRRRPQAKEYSSRSGHSYFGRRS